MEIYGFSPFGYEGSPVKVEVDLRRGIPAIEIVGLAGGAVREARERMKAAIRNSALEFPAERVLINLSPADVKKEGSGFDLPIALGVLAAADKTSRIAEGRVMAVGELELSGRIRPVRGTAAAVYTGIEEGIRLFIVPGGNKTEVSTAGADYAGVHIFGAETLLEAFHFLAKQEYCGTANGGTQDKNEKHSITFGPCGTDGEFADVAGQPRLVRALQIAAAGGHNVITFGPPGCGKTLALGRFPALLPKLTQKEAHTVMRIHSLAGILPPDTGLIRQPPFRKPHQNASLQGMTGGGPDCRPGEISLAHNGVLFLDEAAEFHSSVLQALRIPLETGQIVISRAGRTTVFPARFQLLLAANPCPCGNFGIKGKTCICTPQAVEQYWKKFSGPLMDRIDLRIAVRQPDRTQLLCAQNTATAALRSAIAAALSTQYLRQGHRNALLTPAETGLFCRLGKKETELFTAALVRLGLSGRAGHSILKTARTIADMEGVPDIGEAHLIEAVHYRRRADNPLDTGETEPDIYSEFQD